jgi:hypothetical protein
MRRPVGYVSQSMWGVAGWGVAGDSGRGQWPGTQLSHWGDSGRGHSFRIGGAASTRPLARDLLATFLFACDHAALTGRLPLAMPLIWRGGIGSGALRIGTHETRRSFVASENRH